MPPDDPGFRRLIVLGSAAEWPVEAQRLLRAAAYEHGSAVAHASNRGPPASLRPRSHVNVKHAELKAKKQCPQLDQGRSGLLFNLLALRVSFRLASAEHAIGDAANPMKPPT